MSRGINKVILIGNVGVPPKVHTANNGNCIVNLSIATSESWKDKQTGEQKEKTEWHTVVCFNRLGEIMRDYVAKGSKLYVEGKLRTRKWQDKDGKDHYSTEIVASEVQMLNKVDAPAPQQATNHPAPPPSNQPQGTYEGENVDDDIPF